ncbi:MAG: TIM barrel protein [Oscillospiraceae bacterium]|nr:TIM barrel protein [Oscillospiraceae bacterium]
MKFHIIPDRCDLIASLELAERYNAAFEYNDFFLPRVLDNKTLTDNIISSYLSMGVPAHSTLHGAFLDVTVFSSDKRIFEVSDMRVRQSMDIAQRMGAEAVIFHTNYIANFLSESYREDWLSKNIAYWTKILEDYPDKKIYIENMFDETPELIARLGENLKAHNRFGICYDYAHASVFGHETEKWSMSVAPFTKHLHINDNDLISDLHLALGDGKIDWNRFFELYDTKFADCTVLIEVTGIEKQLRSFEFIEKNFPKYLNK